jgi:hypothetical protein
LGVSHTVFFVAALGSGNAQANTTAVVLVSSGMSHVEGGWPKEVDHTEVEQVIRFRRKVEKDEDYIKQVVRLGAVVEGLVKQNNAIDIYEQYFAGGRWLGRQGWLLGSLPLAPWLLPLVRGNHTVNVAALMLMRPCMQTCRASTSASRPPCAP